MRNNASSIVVFMFLIGTLVVCSNSSPSDVEKTSNSSPSKSDVEKALTKRREQREQNGLSSMSGFGPAKLLDCKCTKTGEGAYDCNLLFEYDVARHAKLIHLGGEWRVVSMDNIQGW